MMFDWVLKSFKRQVILMLFGGIFIVGVFAISKLYTDEKQQLNTILESQVMQMAYRFSLSIADKVFYNNYFELSDNIFNIYEYNHKYAAKSGALFKIIKIAVVNSKNEIVGHSNPVKNPIGTLFSNKMNFAQSSNSLVSKLSWDKAHTHFEVRTPILLSNELIGYLYIDINPIFLQEHERKLLQNIVFLVFIFLILLIAFTFFFANWLDKPLLEIINTLGYLGNGDIKFHTSLKRKDEFFILANSIQNADKRIFKQKEELLSIQKELEERVELRTQELQQKAKTLEDANLHLKTAQKQLVETEKMSALGSLVAGVAHEINTPLGVSITGSTYIESETRDILEKLKDNSLGKKNLEDYLDVTLQMSSSMSLSLHSAAQLVRSFKQVAIDQHTEEKRSFNLYEYFQEVLRSLHSKTKLTNIHIVNEVDEDIVINSYAGLYSQMLTNFLMNSIIHGYHEKEEGIVRIGASINKTHLQIIYQDDGKGLAPEVLDKMFNPFFTTKLGQGGSGLGLSIIYNLITHKLNGDITCESTLGEGMKLNINIPLSELS